MIREQAREFVLKWIRGRQGSAAELVRAIQEDVGWPARLVLPSILDELRGNRQLPDAGRKYLRYTLSGGEVTQALAEGAKPDHEHQSSLDELFGRSRRFRHSRKFTEAVAFVSKFREYSPFNNMLAYLQNPLATYFATARHWHKAFGRSVKEDARGMILLAPRTPVLLVYDIADTEGPPLPDKLRVFTETPGRFNPATLDRTIKNAARDRIRVERKPMGQLRGGFATTRLNGSAWKMRIGLREELSPASAYSVLCHELAHIYLGHVGAGEEGSWPYRTNLTEAVAEIEAESVAYIICRRAGLETRSVEYLSSHVEDNSDIEAISLDLVSRVAGRIEEMGRRLMPPREDAREI
ncbi:MAG TPA: hypothetical protein VGN61_08365 [Verrucomicrobiae bacterium]|jgi:hypothetical protein